MNNHSEALKKSCTIVLFALPWLGSVVKAEISPLINNELGTIVNGSLKGTCSNGVCQVSGGKNVGINKFHAFKEFDTRGNIKRVNVQTNGQENIILGVASNNGTFINKKITFSQDANIFVLSLTR